ncbi:hypothetical protein DIURU_002452 [Diutina rugosa]|uniref:RAM signaling network component n=1 Tax=Diutina rugosa TaxID=5481 RepID=A0A642UV82_DIURU|nr:uncharacterized protein DIURU_002452 [Diutina rugosa]KAA8903566.1 hypothetical protein DIURU_002452 [Diutina rugosa]
MASRSQILSYLNDRSEQISASRAIKVCGLNQSNSDITAAQVVDIIHEFLYSFQPPLEVDQLVLSNNNFEEFPSNLALVARSVKYLDLHSNNFRGIPELGELSRVEILDLSSNKISFISPNWLRNMTHLKVLQLKSNRLRYLPSALGRLTNLNLIEVGDNPLLMPSLDLIRQLQNQTSDLDWVRELKNYLIANGAKLDAKIAQEQSTTSHAFSIPSAGTTTITTSSNSGAGAIGESANADAIKSARATRRMGLIMKKDDDTEETGSSPIQLSRSVSALEQMQIVTPPPIPKSPTSAQNSPASRKRSNTLKEIDKLLEKNDGVDTEHRSAAYFRRLSTLQESEEATNVPRQISQSQISTLTRDSGNIKPRRSSLIKVSRKLLFAFSELHSSIRRFTGFCTDKKITMKMVSSLYTTKATIDALVENLEVMDENTNNTSFTLEQISASLLSCIGSVKSIIKVLGESLIHFMEHTDVCFIRSLYLTFYGSINELSNAYRLLAKPPQISIPDPKVAVNTSSSYDTDDIDERLYRAIDSATAEAMVVFGELTKAISGGASNGANIAKVKELTSICMTSMEITKRLKTKMVTIRNNPSLPTKRAFWDETNSFLKSIVQTFMHVKGIMQDLPILNEVRSSMSTLTKTTKDVTILLEVSSYKSISEVTSATATHPPPLASIPSVSAIFQITTPTSSVPQVRTPLVASLGAAAQAIKPVNPDGGPMLSPSLHYAKTGINPFDGLAVDAESR